MAGHVPALPSYHLRRPERVIGCGQSRGWSTPREQPPGWRAAQGRPHAAGRLRDTGSPGASIVMNTCRKRYASAGPPAAPAIIRAATALSAVPLVPEIRLHLAAEPIGLWEHTERAMRLRQPLRYWWMPLALSSGIALVALYGGILAIVDRLAH